MGISRSIIIIIVLLAFSRYGYMQSYITIQGKVIDSQSLAPLLAATASVPGTTIGTICDEQGRFKLKIPKQFTYIEISYVGYDSKRINLANYDDKQSIKLKRSDSYLEEITILAKPPIIPLTKRIESVKDFAIEENRILLLSKHRKDGYLLKLTNYEGDLIDSYQLDGYRGIEQLTTSCVGTHFLLTEYYSYQIDLTDNKISILYKDKRSRYDQYIANCLDANTEYYYLNYKKRYDQISNVKGHHRYLDKTILFGVVSDDLNAENYFEERKYLDFMDNKSEDQWIHQTEYNGLQNFYDFWEKAATLKYNFYHPVDFHLHAKENSVFILDHEKHLMKEFTLDGKVINNIPIQYSKQQKWSGKIFTDFKTGKLYTYFNYSKRKLLYEIDLTQGSLVPIAEFEDLTHIDDFQIYDETIFFTNSGVVQGQEARILKRIDFGF